MKSFLKMLTYTSGSSGRGDYNGNGRSNGSAGGYSYNGGGGSRGGSSRGGPSGGMRDFSSSNQRRSNPNQHDEINLNKPVWNSQNMKPFEKQFFRETSAAKGRPQVVSNSLSF